jgi:hypothetical protein
VCVSAPGSRIRNAAVTVASVRRGCPVAIRRRPAGPPKRRASFSVSQSGASHIYGIRRRRHRHHARQSPAPHRRVAAVALFLLLPGRAPLMLIPGDVRADEFLLHVDDKPASRENDKRDRCEEKRHRFGSRRSGRRVWTDCRVVA